MAPPWLDVLDETIGVCAEHRRPDLAHRLRQKRARLLDPKLRVLVVGEPNQGKSQLINALVNAPVCAVGDDITTTAPTVVQHADAPSAALVTDPIPSPRQAIPSGEQAAERVAVPIDEVSRQVSRRAGSRLSGELVRAEIGIPRQLLATGLVFIDTPPIDSLRPNRTPRALASLDQADTVLFASDATAELSAAELDLLTRISKACPNVIVALTKIDLTARWRLVANRNREHLAGARVPARLVPVSATLRLAAARSGDTTINTESGFPDLIGCLQQEVLTKSDQAAPRAVAVLTSGVIGQLAATLRSTNGTVATVAPDGPAAKLNESQRQMDELRRCMNRWQTMLSDEMADLISDVEHDLRERTRAILRELDRAFDQADPLMAWETFTEWLVANLADATEANFGWLVERCRWLADKIAGEFPILPGGEAPAEPILEFPPDPVAGEVELDDPHLDRYTLGQRAFTALRGSYGGVLMFGLMTSIAGLPLINPISLGAGAAFGGKSIRDESDMRLKRRQAAAKTTAQRYVDDVFLLCSKECRDVARHVQRNLRDHFNGWAEHLQTEIMTVAQQAKEAMQAAATGQERHSQLVKQEMEKLALLHQRVQQLAAARATLTRANTPELPA